MAVKIKKEKLKIKNAREENQHSRMLQKTLWIPIFNF
jgi:hypothetical protein